MIYRKNLLNEKFEGKTMITIEMYDPYEEKSFIKLLEDIKSTANKSHSFHVTVDPELENRSYFIDGDGAIRFDNITIEKVSSKR